MPNYRYRALSQSGEMVHGTIAAETAGDVIRRIEYLKLLPIEAIEDKAARAPALGLSLGRPAASEVTTFTRDLSLLLKAGARLEDALELLGEDSDVGRLRPVVAKIRAAILSGESFSDAIERHPTLFPAMYVALARVGEVSGTLDHVLELLGVERVRSEAMRRKLVDAMQYPTFVLLASFAVMIFFFMFVLPQFGTVLRDFGGKTDTAMGTFLDISHFMRAYATELVLATSAAIVGVWLLLRQPSLRASMLSTVSGWPGLSGIFRSYRTSLFCRNLGILLGSGVGLTATLRILVNIMAVTGSATTWSEAADRVRHGGKLSEALAAAGMLPPMAIRMLRLGEETGQLAQLSGRIAEFYEAKLQRSLDRVVGVVGPAAIIFISTVVGGLIVSVMTALLSVTQLVQ